MGVLAAPAKKRELLRTAKYLDTLSTKFSLFEVKQEWPDEDVFLFTAPDGRKCGVIRDSNIHTYVHLYVGKNRTSAKPFTRDGDAHLESGEQPFLSGVN